MNILGKWYWNPGDIPAPFVYPLVLHEDGRAEWLGGSGGVERYQLLQGKLYIGSSKRSHSVFQLGDDGDEFLSGVIRQPFEPHAEDLADLPEEERAGPHYFTDSVTLMRDPGELEVLLDDTEATEGRLLAANDQEPSDTGNDQLALL
jgi:hypothetical protein